MLRRNIISAQYIDIIHKALIASGVSRENAFCILNIRPDELETLNSFISINRVVEMWKASSGHLNNPLLALEAGTYISYSYYGIIGHLALAAKSLQQALQVGLKYENLINSSFHTDLIYSDEYITSRLECSCLDAEQFSSLAEFDFSSILYMAKSLVSSDDEGRVHPHEVHFKHRAKGDIKQYEDVLQCKVKFEQGFNQMIIRRETLDVPTKSADTEIFNFILGKIKKINRSTPVGHSSFLESIKHYLRESLVNGLPSASETAEHFSISVSTLKRRLTEENCSFSRLVQEVKSEVAISLLNENKPIAEISLFLGFSNTSAFNRAFNSWVGMKPKEFIKKSRIS